MRVMIRTSNDERARVGLCVACVHARTIPHPRGGDAYYRCGLSEHDPRFPRFPKIPVLQCSGYEAAAGPDKR